MLESVCHALPPILSGPIAQRIQSRAARATDGAFVTRTLTGSLYAHRTGDMIGDRMRMFGYFDWRVLALAAEYTKPGDTIIEIGANTGSETVGFAQIVGPTGSVIAFEPEPTVVKVLQTNLKINGFAQVLIVPAAVSDRSGSLTFVSPGGDNSGVGHVAGAGESTGVTVRAVTLNEFSSWSWHTCIDGGAAFMSMDAEGSEVAVLRGGDEYLRRYRPVMVVEAAPRHLERAGEGIGSLLAALKALEYEPYDIRAFGVRPIVASDCTGYYQQNWLCVPKERGVNFSRIASLFAKNLLTPNIGKLHPLAR